MITRFVFFLIVVGVLPLYAETPEQFFDEANQAYRQAKYAEAIQKYEQILESGNRSGELYYNLGNAYYKSGNIGKAILNYERAVKWLGDDDDLSHNLQLANIMITDKIEPVPRLFLWDWWDGIKSAFTLDEITWLGFFFFAAVIGAVIVGMIAPSYVWRRSAFLGGFVGLIFMIVCVVIFAGKLDYVKNSDYAIVTADITTVKNSPDRHSTDAFVLHSGIKILVIDNVNDWVKIRLADGKVGWMERTAIEVI